MSRRKAALLAAFGLSLCLTGIALYAAAVVIFPGILFLAGLPIAVGGGVYAFVIADDAPLVDTGIKKIDRRERTGSSW